MTSAIDLVASSLRIIGAASRGETIGSHKLSEGLEAMNQMLGGWSGQPNALYFVSEDTFTLTASDGEYSIGPSGDIDTTRPTKILNAYIRDDNSDYDLELVDRKQYDAVGYKTTTGIPRFLYYEPTMTTGEIQLYPEPDSAYTLVIKSLKPFTTTYEQEDTVSLPPGYLEAIKFNLAVRLGPEYGRPITPDVAALAVTTLQILKNQNASYRTSVVRSNPFNNNYGYDIVGDVVL